MTRRTAEADDQIRAMLQARTSGSNGRALLDEIERRSTSIQQLRSRPARALRGAQIIALAGVVFLAVALVSLRQTVPVAAGPATVRPDASRGAVPMSAGRWVTSTFQPTVAFSVPDRVWVATVETRQRLSLGAFLADTATAGELSFSWLGSTYPTPCTTGASGPATTWQGASAQEFMTWLGRVSPVDPGSPRAVSIAGHPGLEVAFTIPPGTEARCPGAALTHELALGPDGSENGTISVPLGTDRVRIAAVVVDSRTLLVITATSDPVHFGEVAAVADPVIGSLEVR